MTYYGRWTYKDEEPRVEARSACWSFMKPRPRRTAGTR